MEVGGHRALVWVQTDSESQFGADFQILGGRPPFFLRIAKEDGDFFIYAWFEVARADVDHTYVHVGNVRDGSIDRVLAHETSAFFLLLRHFSLLSPRDTREGVLKVSLLRTSYHK